MVSLTANENELIERLIKRGRDSGRSDDTPEIIKQRQEVYWKQTSPLVNFYNLINNVFSLVLNFKFPTNNAFALSF